jgi:phage major head subunit gpT-like protein
MPMSTKEFDNLYTRKIDRAFFEAWDEEPEQWSKYLQNESSDQNNETVQTFAGIGKWSRKDELQNPIEQKFKLGDLIVTEHIPFAVEVVMSREQIADSRYKEVENMTKDAGHAGRETVEDECANVLDDAFTVNQYDGVPLCDDAHPNRGDVGGTQSNLATGALTDANLKSGLVLFRKQKDEAGKQIMSRAKKLVVHQAQQFNAATILQSTGQSGTANNDKNTVPNLELVELDFITSETAWFLLGARHQLKHYWREQPEFVKEKYMRSNGSQCWQGYFRHSVSVENWRQCVGSTGL